MNPSRRNALLLAATLLLGGCAASGPYATMPQGQPVGWVVVAMSKDMNYSTMEISIKPVDGSWGGRGMGVNPMVFNATYHQFGEKKGGYVRASQFTPGTYHITNVRLVYAPSNWVYTSKADFSVPFEVKAGEVTYLGEFLATGTIVKPVILIPNVDVPYFIISDQQSRDMAIAVAETPELKGLPVKRAALQRSSSTPFFRTTRMPEK